MMQNAIPTHYEMMLGEVLADTKFLNVSSELFTDNVNNNLAMWDLLLTFGARYELLYTRDIGERDLDPTQRDHGHVLEYTASHPLAAASILLLVGAVGFTRQYYGYRHGRDQQQKHVLTPSCDAYSHIAILLQDDSLRKVNEELRALITNNDASTLPFTHFEIKRKTATPSASAASSRTPSPSTDGDAISTSATGGAPAAVAMESRGSVVESTATPSVTDATEEAKADFERKSGEAEQSRDASPNSDSSHQKGDTTQEFVIDYTLRSEAVKLELVSTPPLVAKRAANKVYVYLEENQYKYVIGNDPAAVLVENATLSEDDQHKLCAIDALTTRAPLSDAQITHFRALLTAAEQQQQQQQELKIAGATLQLVAKPSDITDAQDNIIYIWHEGDNYRYRCGKRTQVLTLFELPATERNRLRIIQACQQRNKWGRITQPSSSAQLDAFYLALAQKKILINNQPRLPGPRRALNIISPIWNALGLAAFTYWILWMGAAIVTATTAVGVVGLGVVGSFGIPLLVAGIYLLRKLCNYINNHHAAWFDNKIAKFLFLTRPMNPEGKHPYLAACANFFSYIRMLALPFYLMGYGIARLCGLTTPNKEIKPARFNLDFVLKSLGLLHTAEVNYRKAALQSITDSLGGEEQSVASSPSPNSSPSRKGALKRVRSMTYSAAMLKAAQSAAAEPTETLTLTFDDNKFQYSYIVPATDEAQAQKISGEIAAETKFIDRFQLTELQHDPLDKSSAEQKYADEQLGLSLPANNSGSAVHYVFKFENQEATAAKLTRNVLGKDCFNGTIAYLQHCKQHRLVISYGDNYETRYQTLLELGNTFADKQQRTGKEYDELVAAFGSPWVDELIAFAESSQQPSRWQAFRKNWLKTQLRQAEQTPQFNKRSRKHLLECIALQQGLLLSQQMAAMQQKISDANTKKTALSLSAAEEAWFLKQINKTHADLGLTADEMLTKQVHKWRVWQFILMTALASAISTYIISMYISWFTTDFAVSLGANGSTFAQVAVQNIAGFCLLGLALTVAIYSGYKAYESYKANAIYHEENERARIQNNANVALFDSLVQQTQALSKRLEELAQADALDEDDRRTIEQLRRLIPQPRITAVDHTRNSMRHGILFYRFLDQMMSGAFVARIFVTSAFAAIFIPTMFVGALSPVATLAIIIVTGVVWGGFRYYQFYQENKLLRDKRFGQAVAADTTELTNTQSQCQMINAAIDNIQARSGDAKRKQYAGSHSPHTSPNSSDQTQLMISMPGEDKSTSQTSHAVGTPPAKPDVVVVQAEQQRRHDTSARPEALSLSTLQQQQARWMQQASNNPQQQSVAATHRKVSSAPNSAKHLERIGILSPTRPVTKHAQDDSELFTSSTSMRAEHV